MFKKLFNRIKHQRPDPEEARKALEYIREMSKNAQCIIVGITPEGTRIIIIGKDKLTTQLEEIEEIKEVVI